MKKITFFALLLAFSQIAFANSIQQKSATPFILFEKHKPDKSYNLMMLEGNRIFLTNSSSSIKVSSKKSSKYLATYLSYKMTVAITYMP
jgi:hypothetical protein